MPALDFLGRRWRTASDDFTCSSVLYFALSLAAGIVALLRTTVRGGITIIDCPQASLALTKCVFGLGCVDVVCAAFFAATAVVSLRGAVFEVSKRKLVPILLYGCSAASLAAFVLCCIATKYALYNREAWKCSTGLATRLLQCIVALNFVFSLMYIVSFIVVFRPSGRRSYQSVDEYERHWWKRFRCLCCRCMAESGENEGYKDVAHVMARAFRGYDIVPSDLAAGMLLLHGYQEQSQRLISSRITYAPNPNGHRERISSQARPSSYLTQAQKETVRDLQTYSRFYMAAYGWMLHEYQHCGSGMVQLCCYDPCMCCRHRHGRHYNAGCYCDLTALLKQTKVDEEDVLVSSWRNSLFKPVYYVAFDDDTDALVIAMRGTMSVIDCITDFAATPRVIPLNDSNTTTWAPEDFYVHGGMLQSAEYVRRCLEYNGILQQITSCRFAGKKIVVLGHSLGAGVALILSTLLWSEFPDIRGRLRCLAYAPPGGTLSEAVVDYCKDFTVGCFMGYDMIPRLAMHTFDGFRESIFDVLAASDTPKTLLLMNACRTEAMTQSFHPSTRTPGGAVAGSPESQRYREALRNAPCVPAVEPPKLFPCATLVHFRKAVEVFSTPCSSEDVYIPVFETLQEVQVLLSAPTMFTDHFPDRFLDVLKETRTRMDDGELDRFYLDADAAPSPLNESEAPFHYVAVRVHNTVTEPISANSHSSRYGLL